MTIVLGLAMAGCSPPPGSSTPSPATTGAAPAPTDPSSSTDTTPTTGTGADDPAPTDSEPGGPADLSAFCAAVAEINKIPDSDTMTQDERQQAIATIDHLLSLWPPETKKSAEIYFGRIRDILEAGQVVDLENTTPEFQEAFGIVFEYVADTCPGGFG